MASGFRYGRLLSLPLLALLLLPDCLAFSPLAPSPASFALRTPLVSNLRHRAVTSVRERQHRPVVCSLNGASEDNVKESIAKMEMGHALEGGTVAERLEKTLAELRTLQSTVKGDIKKAEDVLAEKRKVLEVVDDRMKRLTRELLQAEVEEEMKDKKITPGVAEDVTVRSTSELRYQLKEQPGGVGGSGPIYLCVPNKVLRECIEATPLDRRPDLVFIGSGHLEELLKEFDLQDNTQALLFFAISKLGAAPKDGSTPNNPEGLTCATGAWAQDFAMRLRSSEPPLRCSVLPRDHFRSRALRRLIWTCAVHLVGKLHGLKKVGEVASSHASELEAMMSELAAALRSELAETVAPESIGDLVAYTNSVPDFPVVVKDLTFRNGFFYDLSKAALKEKRPDPCPSHSKGLRKIKAVK